MHAASLATCRGRAQEQSQRQTRGGGGGGARRTGTGTRRQPPALKSAKVGQDAVGARDARPPVLASVLSSRQQPRVAICLSICLSVCLSVCLPLTTCRMLFTPMRILYICVCAARKAERAGARHKRADKGLPYKLNKPCGLAFTPDGTLLVADRCVCVCVSVCVSVGG